MVSGREFEWTSTILVKIGLGLDMFDHVWIICGRHVAELNPSEWLVSGWQEWLWKRALRRSFAAVKRVVPEGGIPPGISANSSGSCRLLRHDSADVRRRCGDASHGVWHRLGMAGPTR